MRDEMGENEHTGAAAVYVVLAMLGMVWSGLCGGLYYILTHLK